MDTSWIIPPYMRQKIEFDWTIKESYLFMILLLYIYPNMLVKFNQIIVNNCKMVIKQMFLKVAKFQVRPHITSWKLREFLKLVRR